MSIDDSKQDPRPNSSKRHAAKGRPTARTLTKSHKGAILVPKPQQERIRMMYVQGMSMNKIAKAVHRDVHTISKVVRSQEMQELQEAVRKRYWAIAMQAVDSVESHMERDGWLAREVLRDVGVIEQRQTVRPEVTAQRPMGDAEEERAVNELTARIVRASIERHKIFKLPMPQLEQMEDEEKEDKRPLLERRDRADD